MDRKQLLCEMYASNKLDFSGDEEELMKGVTQSPETQSAGELDQDVQQVQQVNPMNVDHCQEQPEASDCKENEKSESEQQVEEDEEEEEMDEEVEESFDCEDEELEDEHEVTLLKGGDEEEEDDDANHTPDHQGQAIAGAQLPKMLVNQNLNLNRAFAKNKNAYPATPAIIKRKQTKAWFNSPTDSCLSPCTQKIFKNRKPL